MPASFGGWGEKLLERNKQWGTIHNSRQYSMYACMLSRKRI